MDGAGQGGSSRADLPWRPLPSVGRPTCELTQTVVIRCFRLAGIDHTCIPPSTAVCGTRLPFTCAARPSSVLTAKAWLLHARRAQQSHLPWFQPAPRPSDRWPSDLSRPPPPCRHEYAEEHSERWHARATMVHSIMENGRAKAVKSNRKPTFARMGV